MGPTHGPGQQCVIGREKSPWWSTWSCRTTREHVPFFNSPSPLATARLLSHVQEGTLSSSSPQPRRGVNVHMSRMCCAASPVRRSDVLALVLPSPRCQPPRTEPPLQPSPSPQRWQAMLPLPLAPAAGSWASTAFRPRYTRHPPLGSHGTGASAQECHFAREAATCGSQTRQLRRYAPVTHPPPPQPGTRNPEPRKIVFLVSCPPPISLNLQPGGTGDAEIRSWHSDAGTRHLVGAGMDADTNL